MKKYILGNTEPTKQRRWVRWLLELAVFAVIIFGLRAWQHRGMLDGDAPDFERIATNGTSIHLQAYRGKPVLLHFWADWCPMCAMEQGAISAIAKDHAVITVAFPPDGEEDIPHYMARKQITDWVTIVDADGKLAQQYGVHGVPANYIIDKNGKISFSEVGISSGWGLRIRLWLAELLA
ncbi:MAG: redoxin domain-containing protein [Thiothrix sp.]|uniref:redoxin domain-containing protein n=1 Tax=Thiothrix sp. TaxID=1032 RepID=UPI00261FA7AF|nr:redoxin domain-containing protein [Thiothrix sp.]MDD5391835.1 redoxin domain-containing protein [Thiothrix sp.]